MLFSIKKEEKYCSGIYIIENVINKKIYIGSAKNFKKRHSNHVKDLRAKNHHSIRLQKDWDLYGENSFLFKILEIVDKKSYVKIYIIEQKHLDYKKSYLDIIGYNICKNAKSRKGIISRPETIEKLKKSNTGKRHTKESKEKMSFFQKQRKREPLSEEVKNKISNSQKGEKSIWFGKKQTEEHKYNVKQGVKHVLKKVLQYDLNGNFIKEFESISEASLKTSYSQSHISKCIKGKRKTHNNYIWKEKK